MRTKILIKSLLAAAGLCMGANAWADGTSAGAGIDDFTTGWWSDFTKLYTLNSNGTYEFNFTTTNVNDGNVYKTWLLIATNGNDSHGGGGTEYFVYRGDGYAWGQSKNSNPYDETTNADGDPTNLVCSNTYSTANPEGAGLQSAMNGASVNMKIYRLNNTIAVRATVTPTSENPFTMSFDYRFANVSSENIGLCFSVENAYLNITSASYTPATVQTYDFKTFAASTGSEYTAITSLGNAAYRVNSAIVIIPEDYPNLRWHNNYVLQSDFKFRYKNSNGGLYNDNSNRNFAVQNVKAGDAITIAYSSFQSGQAIYSKSSNLSATFGGAAIASDVSLTNGATYYVISDADHLDLNTNGKGIRIESIKIAHTAPETVTAPSMELTSVGDGYTTVTISAGTASYGDVVTTYYTTDGSTPTTSSSSFTGATGNVNITANGTTIKAYSVVTDTQSSTKTAPASSVTSGEFDAIVAFSNAPTFAFKTLNGTSRTYTITNNNTEGTLYYTTSVSEEQPEIGSGSYTALAYGTSTTVDVEVSASGNLYAYAVLANGTTTSSVASQAVEAVALTLATPVYSVSGLTRNDNGTITGATFTITDPGNTNLLGTPTATLHYTLTDSDASVIAESDIASGNTYSPTAFGTLTITASATGYTSASVKIPVSNLYVVDWTSRDYTTTGPDDLDTNWSTSGSWSELGASVYSRGANFTLDHLYNVNTALEYIAGWGLGRDHENALAMTIRDGKAGYIEVLKLNTSANSGKVNADVNATPSYAILFDKTTGNQSYSLPKRNIIQQHYQYKPAISNLSIEVTSAGWATLFTPYAIDFSDTGLTAYTASLTDNTVTLNQVSNVPANTGVVLKGAENTYSIPVIASSTTEQGDLKGSTTVALTYDAEAENDYYMLALNDADEAQFTKLTSGTIAAGKAYLQIAKNAAPNAISVVFADESTGIAAVGQATVANDRCYNLSGQRVSTPQKGLYIKDGKKYIIK